MIRELLIGFCLGTANIIPGISGGTFLLVFKIYGRVFSILGNINKKTLTRSFTLIARIIRKFGKDQSIHEFVSFLRENDFIFMLKLIIGAVLAITALSDLMKYLLINHFSITYSLFFGIILVSIIIPLKMINLRKAYLVLFFIPGILSAFYVSYSADPYEKIRKKSLFYENQYILSRPATEKQDTDKRLTDKTLPFTGKYTTGEYIYAGICGAVSASAMILPGISGSLILILMEEYFQIISAISGLKSLNLDSILFLTSFAAGIISGGLLFAQSVNYILKEYHDATMAFLAGLTAGSLYALWPFKKYIIMAEQYVKHNGGVKIIENIKIYTNDNIFPQSGSQLIYSIISFLTGCFLMYFFIRKKNSSSL